MKAKLMELKPKFNEPIERESIAEQVAARILGMVTSGTLKPGDQLPPERELAQALNVSRPTVREAIRGLTILGVAKTRQGGGAYISSLDADALLGPIRFYIALEDVNLQELYHARSLIEGDVARAAASKISDEAIADLSRLIDAQKKCLDDPSQFRVLDYEFHSIIWREAHNAFLKRIGESLNSIGLEIRTRASEDRGILTQSVADHGHLLEALAAHDAEAAQKAAERHMMNVYNSTVKTKERKP